MKTGRPRIPNQIKELRGTYRKDRASSEIIEYNKRPVSAVADSQEIRNIKAVEIFLDFSIEKRLLFDEDNNLQERVFKEQFFKDKTY